MMVSFFISVHACPSQAAAGPMIQLGGQSFATLAVALDALGTTMMPLSFEAARASLAQFDRMYTEPDGSFVWVSAQGTVPWQVDGNLFDRDERLLFVDLRGSCPAEQFDQLLRAFGWPKTRLIFQLTREAVLLDENEFRRHAAEH
ncbi:MAG TPA: hypothetical protein VHV08_16275 [Pirellulales bacterium]|nr:hypothetical protein [Pirellulales bacterium]